MGRPIQFALAGALAAGLSVSALAADLPPPPILEPGPAPLDVTSGWYLRGDVGVASYNSARWTQPPSDNGSRIISSGFITDSLSGGAFVGVGAGYQFNNWLRADVTGEYRSAVHAAGTFQEVTQFFDSHGLVNFVGQNNYRGNFSSAVVLFNGYIDLFSWNSLTPFIGGGAGFAHNRLSGFTDNGYASLNGAVFPVMTNLVEGGTKTDFAWALHAGLAFEATPNLKLELAYRFLHLGEAKSGNVLCDCGVSVPGFRIKDIEAHEIKLGMRWLFGAHYAEAPPPLVRKY